MIQIGKIESTFSFSKIGEMRKLPGNRLFFITLKLLPLPICVYMHIYTRVILNIYF